MLRKEWNIPAQFNIKKDIIFHPELSDAYNLLSRKEYQIKIFDEGYFIGYNMDFNTTLAKETIKIAMETRDRHNIIMFNFQRPTRTVKGLFEKFKIMNFKPSKDIRVILARSNLSVLSEDPWQLGPVLKQKTDKGILNALVRNPNYIKGLTARKITPKLEEIFKATKKDADSAANLKKTTPDELSESLSKTMIKTSEIIFKKIDGGDMALSEIDEYLRKTFKFTDSQLKSFKTTYNKYEMQEKLRRAQKVNDELESEVENHA